MGRYDEDFEVAYAELFVRAQRVAGRIVSDRAAAEDIAAETMVRALSSWRRVRSYSAPWVTRVATNLAVDLVRRRRPTTGLEALPPADGPVDAAERMAVIQALGELPARQRQALVLRYVVGLSGNEVAEAMGLSPGTVKVHLHRGRRALRTQFTDEDEEVCHADR